jgi:hypothetical protein
MITDQTRPSLKCVSEPNPLTRDDAFKSGATGFDVHTISKGLSDLAVRNFNRDHPGFDIATIYPSFIFGPFGPGQVYDTPATGTNRHIYALIASAPGHPVRGTIPRPAPPSECQRPRRGARPHARADASPLPLKPEAVHPVHAHVCVERSYRTSRREETGTQGTSARDYGKRTPCWTVRHARHQQNGERAWHEDLLQVAGHRFGYS